MFSDYQGTSQSSDSDSSAWLSYLGREEYVPSSVCTKGTGFRVLSTGDELLMVPSQPTQMPTSLRGTKENELGISKGARRLRQVDKLSPSSAALGSWTLSLPFVYSMPSDGHNAEIDVSRVLVRRVSL